MRIAVFGTGGAGGYFGGRLAQAGENVTFIARGEHLRAIRASGLHLDTPEGEIAIAALGATDDPRRVGVVDVVILGVKAWQVEEAALAMRPMLGPDTFVVPLQNGVEAAEQLVRVLGIPYVVGGLCATLSRVSAPGRISTVGQLSFIRFAELDGAASERTQQLCSAFLAAGVQADIPADIHVALWEKFVFVVPFGGVGAVTRAPIGVMRSLPETRRMLEEAMWEIVAVGRARGVALGDGVVAAALARMDSLPPDGTSSLQRDIAEGKPSELNAWTGAVLRLGQDAGVGTPLHQFLYASLLPLERRARERTLPMA